MAASAGAAASRLGVTPDGREFVRLAYDVTPYELVDPTKDGAPEKWIHVLPLGQVDARDGRSFRVDNAAALIASCELPMLVDWEHQSEFWMGSTEAAGWIEEFAVEPGGSGRFPSAGIWGRVEWTPEGQKDTDGKAYRYLSPVLLLEVPPPPVGMPSAERSMFESRTVLQVVSVALTNTPALRMQAIDSFRERLSARFGPLGQEKRTMDPEKRKALCAALGLAENATDEQLVTAAQKPVPEKALCASLTGQVGQLTAEISQLKTEIEAGKTAAFQADVKLVLDQASKDGKVPPAARAGYEAMCATREGFASFRDSILPHLIAIGGKAPASAPAATAGATSTPAVVTERLRKRGVDEKTEKEAHAYLASSRGRPNMED